MNNEGMKMIIETINKLQDAFAMSGMNFGQLDLPKIAVVGGQSSGKSSVLENFVGRDFLPRGTGIVTRRPLILQLHCSRDEYATFLHKPGERFTDFSEVRKEIMRDTDKVTGSNKGISDIPINLRIYSPNVLDLTVVDLPGITKVPVGDQPPDIEEKVKEMILRYISNENTLILAVSPANVDLPNSDSLKFSMQVDPEGKRTIGVITKLDLMDAGTDAREVLENKVFPLQRGYVAVINRSQKDIDEQKEILAAQESEMEFISHHPAYKHLADRMGSKYLQGLLNKQLYEHIRDKFPQLRSQLKHQLVKVREELEEMRAFEEFGPNEGWRQKLFIRLINDFSDDLKTCVEGQNAQVDSIFLSPGAKMNISFYTNIMKLLTMPTGVTEEELNVIRRNLHGFRSSMFPSGLMVDICIRKIVSKYRDPMLNSVNLISDILLSAVNKCARIFQPYPKFKDEVLLLVNEKIKAFEDETKHHLSIHVEAQKVFINLNHPDFHLVTTPGDVPESYCRPESPPLISEFLEEGTEIPTPLEVVPPGKAEPAAKPKSPQPVDSSKKLTLLQKGWMLQHQSTGQFRPKSYWFVGSPSVLSWYKDETEKELIGSFSLDGAKVFGPAKKNVRIMTLIRSTAKEGTKDVPKTQLEVSAKDEADETVWLSFFEKVGLPVELRIPPPSVATSARTSEWAAATVDQSITTKDDEDEPQGPAAVVGVCTETDMILYMVQSYMNIIHKTIQDLVPKYIVLLLINSTLHYVSRYLLGDLMAKEDWSSLMESSPEEQKKKKDLFRIYEATQKAIEIVNEVTQSSILYEEKQTE